MEDSTVFTFPRFLRGRQNSALIAIFKTCAHIASHLILVYITTASSNTSCFRVKARAPGCNAPRFVCWFRRYV